MELCCGCGQQAASMAQSPQKKERKEKMIVKVNKPRDIKLTQDPNRETFTTKSGYLVVPFIDDKGSLYEKATKEGQPEQWFKVID